MADGSTWVQAASLPPPAGSTDVGQVGIPTPTGLRGTKGQSVVVSTSGTVAVLVAYENAPAGVQAIARVWLPFGTWKMELPADLAQLTLSPPAVPFPGVPEVSVWIEDPPRRNAAC